MILQSIKLDVPSYESAVLDVCAFQTHSEVVSHSGKHWQPSTRPAVIIVPGGGYVELSNTEIDPVALRYLARGYSAFVLKYSLNEDSRFPQPVAQLFAAIRYVRSHANAYHIDPNAIALCGFSAGGHLAGLAATHWADHEFSAILSCDSADIRPNAAVLCYPVTDMKLLAEKDPSYLTRWGAMLQSTDAETSIVRSANASIPPLFIWHTRTDGIVPVTQTLALVNKLEELGAQYELHVYYDGFHGLSTCDVLSNYRGAIQGGYTPVNVRGWIDLAINWSNTLFGFD